MIAQCSGTTRPFTAAVSRPTSRASVACSAQARDPLRVIRDAGAAALLSAALLATSAAPALAELNKFEEEMGGEFGRGSALQFGEADIKGKNFAGQDLRRSNFTAADARDANFKGSKLVGAYFIKTVVARANFEVCFMVLKRCVSSIPVIQHHRLIF